MATDPAELILNRTWRPQLAIIGVDGLPAPQNAGNVLLPYTTAKLSLRLPPTLPGDAMALLKRLLTENPPDGAEVTFEASPFVSQGWNAPELAPWLEADRFARAAQAAFGHEPAYMGEGGSIPFMGMLGEKFPETQFVITGVLGPAFQRAWPERIPAYSNGQTRHRNHRPRPLRPPSPRVDKPFVIPGEQPELPSIVLRGSRHPELAPIVSLRVRVHWV